MPIVTVSWLMNFESNMQRLVENEYARFASPENTWWDLIMRKRTSASGRELLSWFLNTAQLRDTGKRGGNYRFRDPTMVKTEFESRSSGEGLRIDRPQFEDLDGNGVGAATEWARDMGAQFGYWPQLKASELLIAGESADAYDGQPFFDATHPLDPVNGGTGTYSNLIDYSVGKIDASVTLDVAAVNLAKVYKHIRSIKMPNGKQQRMLRPVAILSGPALFPRVSQLLDAKFLAVASAAGGGGTGDFTGYASRMGYGKCVEAPELVDAEYDTSYFVVAEQIGSSQLGAMVYIDREPYSIRYYTGRGGGQGVDAILDRGETLEWHGSGRNVAGYGHPYLLFKVSGS